MPRPGEPESMELVGDGSDVAELGYAVQSRLKFGGFRGGNRGGSAGAEAEGNCPLPRPRAAGKPGEGIWSLGDSGGGDPRRDGQRSGQRRDEVRRKTDKIPFDVPEFL